MKTKKIKHTIESVVKHVDETYLFRLFENEYSVMLDVQSQIEYLETPEGKQMFGAENVKSKMPTLKVELERVKGRVEFLKKKIETQEK